MARCSYYSGLCTLLNIVILVNSVSTSDVENWIDQLVNNNPPAVASEQQPLVELSHTQMCQKAVREISNNIEFNKRDDTFTNLVVNVCFPDVNPDNLMQLLTRLSQLKHESEHKASLTETLNLLFGSKDESTVESTTAAHQTNVIAQDFGNSGKRQEESLATTKHAKLTTAMPAIEAVAATKSLTSKIQPLTSKIQPIAPQPPQPSLSVEYKQVCQKAITQISKDIKISKTVQHSKRDDIFINLVVNVCFPDMNEETILHLLSMLTNHSAPAIPTTPDTEWIAGLLPETGPGQEGLPDIGEVGNEEISDEIAGLPAEIGPGQEGVDEANGVGDAAEETEIGPGQEGVGEADGVEHAAEETEIGAGQEHVGETDGVGHAAAQETDLPDWTGNDNWWDNMLPEDTQGQENTGTEEHVGTTKAPPTFRDMEKDEELERLIARVLLNLVDDN